MCCIIELLLVAAELDLSGRFATALKVLHTWCRESCQLPGVVLLL